MTNEIKLTNFTIRDLLDKWGNQYFLLVDNNTEEAYFCFRRTVQSGWEQLNTGPTELIIEYQEDERENKIYKTDFKSKKANWDKAYICGDLWNSYFFLLW